MGKNPDAGTSRGAAPRTSAAGRRRGRGPVAAVTAGALLATILASGSAASAAPQQKVRQPALDSRSAEIIRVDGRSFRDLDGNGTLTPYEDWRLSPEERATDLVARLSLEEKAGQLMHASLTGRGTYDRAVFSRLLEERHITTFISRLGVGAGTLASEHNDLQALAEQQPFGIPLKISTDPRNGFTVTEGQTVSNGDFTPFPDPIGMGAVDDPETTKAMADIIRREYRAVGIHEALSPQADLATEPRWTRINGTFGATGEEVREHVQAYVEGMQGGSDGLTPDSVATVVKHWVGYGAQVNGYDSHYYYGRYAAFPGNNFEEHLTPYEGAFAAGASGIMPTYSILQDLERNGTAVEQVGANHNEYLLQDVLRGEYGFDGVITSDWGIANDCPASCLALRPPLSFVGAHGAGMPWGVEDLTLAERYASAVNAGVDIIGGSDKPQYILEAVGQGLLGEERVDEAARRVLQQKFELGLFENPYVDVSAAERIVGSTKSAKAGDAAQAASLTLLSNDGVLPVSRRDVRKVFLSGIDADAARDAGFTPVATPAEADLAVVRLADPRGGADLTDLDFSGDEPGYQALLAASDAGIPTVAVPNLARPLILGNVVEHADALLADYGVSDGVLLDVLRGKGEPGGRLPFELPSSMAEVEAQLPDVPNDTAHPLFPAGFGLSYTRSGR
ncbi:glycoside hydrolase family 3 protein [Arthrobacter sp. MDB2-24]